MTRHRKSSNRRQDNVEAPAPSESNLSTDEFKRRLFDEYKILQDKIDKIGGFRFTIKGWSVTALIAASAAGTAAKSFSIALTITVGLLLMLGFFFKFEVEQVRLSRTFGRRARKLENEFIRIDAPKKLGRPAIPVPFTASEILGGAQRNSQGGQSESRKERWRVW